MARDTMITVDRSRDDTGKFLPGESIASIQPQDLQWLSLKLPARLKRRLRLVAAEEETSVSEIVRQALEKFLEVETQ